MVIDDTARGIVKIKGTKDVVEQQIHHLQQKADRYSLGKWTYIGEFICTAINSLKEEVRQHLAKKQRHMATAKLKHEKQILSVLSKRLGALETLETILMKIDSSGTEADVRLFIPMWSL